MISFEAFVRMKSKFLFTEKEFPFTLNLDKNLKAIMHFGRFRKHPRIVKFTFITFNFIYWIQKSLSK